MTTKPYVATIHVVVEAANQGDARRLVHDAMQESTRTSVIRRWAFARDPEKRPKMQSFLPTVRIDPAQTHNLSAAVAAARSKRVRRLPQATDQPPAPT